jgi:hypothetical protein
MKVGRNKKKERHFLLPMQEMEIKTKNGGLLSLTLPELKEYMW